ncbi:ABC transporter permease [Alkalihalobacillus pseudalcaliphilus]|uniref:ABC transporter permease n=1 Tax=Alkalihalobacillus pseudalcaliphilus TaxID=79884 RepID=UPI00064D9D44|nr:ABC transporter permease subunit [Alkalihalobacillus pseudalcaliphilus]KMK75594.1 membrane protein [Alkalihalobacillus pseudalcaliphilus]
MNAIAILVKKEWTESLRNGKWIWLPIALCILGISQPLSMYYLPQLLEAAGGLPEGAVIDIPTPYASEVLIGTLSQFALLGTLLFVLASMNSIAHERNNGSIVFVLVRPVSFVHYILSKWMSLLILFGVSFGLSYFLTWYYTVQLFGTVTLEKLVYSTLIYLLWIGFLIALTLCISTFLRNGAGIAGLTICIVAILALADMLIPAFMKWSPTQLQAEAGQILVRSSSGELWMSLITTLLLTGCLLYIATKKMRSWSKI